MRSMKLVAVFLAAGLALAACGSDDTPTTSATSTTRGSSAPATVSVAAAHGDVEAHLAGPNGHALYLFEKDHGTTSACTDDQCTATWPALTATGTPSGGSGVDASALSTADGQVAQQVVYHGHLLYYFAGDASASDTNGTTIASWYLVAPDGKAIDDD